MADLTPLEKLDDAIPEYLDASPLEHGELGGWALVWQESRIVDIEGMLPLQYGTGLTLGAATSPALAVGLLHAGISDIPE